MAKTIIRDGKIKLQPYSPVEMATVYDVCDRTLKKWLEPFAADIGEKKGRYYTIHQVRVIFEKLGLPGEVSIED